MRRPNRRPSIRGRSDFRGRVLRRACLAARPPARTSPPRRLACRIACRRGDAPVDAIEVGMRRSGAESLAMHPEVAGKPAHWGCRLVIDVKVRAAGRLNRPYEVAAQRGYRSAAPQIARGKARLEFRGLLVVGGVRSQQVEQFACLLVSHREWRQWFAFMQDTSPRAPTQMDRRTAGKRWVYLVRSWRGDA